MALKTALRRVYWEVTASCNLRCIHCRRKEELDNPPTGELTTEEGKRLIDQLAEMNRPLLIFSGGEPLTRSDFFELVAYARLRQLPMALATNGTLVDAGMAHRLKDVGIQHASVSLDGAQAETHDLFRGQGSFKKALQGLHALREAGINVQLDFTVTHQNRHELPAMVKLAEQQKATALYLFLLVPVGCGMELAKSQMLSPAEVEEWLNWVCEHEEHGPLPLKAICAPQIFRVKQQRYELHEPHTLERKGCLAGLHMCFVSHGGEVYPCGYLPVSAGSLKQAPFRMIWNESPLFKRLRNEALLTGRCGACEYKNVCGGCRARGYYAHGDVVAEEPHCVYTPARLDPGRLAG